MSPSIGLNILNGLDSRYDDGGSQNCYDFVAPSFRCKPLA
jgi:hypothetical protein